MRPLLAVTLVLTLVFVCIFGTPDLHAQTDNYKIIEGQVLDLRLKPLQGLRVTLNKVSGIKPTYTNSQGYFLLEVPKSAAVSESSVFLINGTKISKENFTYAPKTRYVSIKVKRENIRPQGKLSSQTFNVSVRNSKDHPLANTQVYVGGTAYFTDSKGRFTLPVLTSSGSQSPQITLIHKDSVLRKEQVVYLPGEVLRDTILIRDTLNSESENLFEDTNLEYFRDSLQNLKEDKVNNEIQRIIYNLRWHNDSIDTNIQYAKALVNKLHDEAKKDKLNHGHYQLLGELEVVLKGQYDNYSAAQEQTDLLLRQIEAIRYQKDSINVMSKAQLEQMRKENEVLEEKRRQERKDFRQKMYLVLSILIGALVVAAVYIRLSRKLKRQNKQIISQTERIKEQNTELSEKNNRLEEMNHEKDSLMNVVAHDLKSPLHKVSGFLQLIPMVGPLNDEQQEYVQTIHVITQSGNKLINDLLDVNAFEHQESRVNPRMIKIAETSEDLLLTYTEQAKAKDIKLSFESGLAEQSFCTDADFLNRVLDNLISNAIKFSPKEKEVSLRINNAGNGQVLLEVADQGPGISDEDKTKMFKKFQKLSARPTGGEPSTGLGLSIVKALVEKLEGRIELESKLGEGSTFKVTLSDLKPVAEETEASHR